MVNVGLWWRGVAKHFSAVRDTGAKIMVHGSQIDVKAAAIAKLRRIQRSSKYRSFFDDAGVEAFERVQSSALAGRSLPDTLATEHPLQAIPDAPKQTR
ncbi:hypothetical protein ALQ85_200143 [Pseudomonas syringae]|nr:hypothetical protein PLA106_02820 [Pseudomonas amygdali pv. lachrymans str. M302278]RMM10890.1 hypothetical protein ALQ85_200143 [Pseudomonas syringae]